MRKTQINRITLAQALGTTLENKNVRLLMKHCVTHHKLQECLCNGCTRERLSGESWLEYDKARVEQIKWVEEREKRIEKRIKELAHNLGFYVLFEGDPRGPTVRFSKVPFTRDWFNEAMKDDVINACVWGWR